MTSGRDLLKRFSAMLASLSQDIWSERGPFRSRRVLTLIRWAHLVLLGFVRDKCHLRATALAYATILSLAPLMAVALSISKALGLQDSAFIRAALLRITAGREELARTILHFVETSSVRTLGYLGTLVLIAMAVAMVITVENAFNAIWGVARGRSLWRKFTDFFSVLVLSPLLVFLAVSFTVSLQSEALVQRMLEFTALNYLHLLALKLAPYVMVWLAFLFLYSFMPHTKVRLRSAAVGAVLAGTLWQLAQWVYIRHQVSLTDYGAIYGSFAQFPLFLIWMYISWVIVLLGGEISYAAQHLSTFEGELRAGRAGFRDRLEAAWLMLVCLARRFEAGRGGLSADALAERLDLPAKLVSDLSMTLADQGFLLRGEADGESIFALGRPANSIRISDVQQSLASGLNGGHEPIVTERFAFARRDLDAALEALRSSPVDLSLEQACRREAGHGPDGCLD
jgi:membrane protein